MFNFLLEEGTQNPGSSWPILLILGVFLVGMLLFSVIPQKRKQKQMAEMSSRIKVGDKIKTIGGLCGTIVEIDERSGLFTILSGTSTFVIDRGCVYSMEMMGVKPQETVTEDEHLEKEDTVSDTNASNEAEVATETVESTEDKKEN